MTYTVYSFVIALNVFYIEGENDSIKERGIVVVYADEDPKEKVLQYYHDGLGEDINMIYIEQFSCTPLIVDVEALVI